VFVVDRFVHLAQQFEALARVGEEVHRQERLQTQVDVDLDDVRVHRRCSFAESTAERSSWQYMS
jgi:hypothetical protein